MTIGADPVLSTHLAATPTRISAAGSGDLTTAWNNFLGLFPSGLTTGLGVVGVVILLGSIIGWWWNGRHGGKRTVKSLPFITIGIGLIFMAPAWLIPIVLTVLSVLARLGTAIVEGFFRLIGS